LKTIQKVKDKYDKSGYIVNLNLETDKEGYLYIVVSETKVRNVKITGNERTKTYVFDDLIAVKPGDYLNRNQLQVTYIELKKSNFFKDVNLNFEPVDNDSVDIVVNVLEKDKKFDFQGGITWGPVKNKPWYEGFAGIISLSSTNPFGYGENFSVSLQKALSTTDLSLNFGIRKPFEMPLSISSSISFKIFSFIMFFDFLIFLINKKETTRKNKLVKRPIINLSELKRKKKLAIKKERDKITKKL